jgi:hypothetical protein
MHEETLRLLKRWLRAPIEIEGKLVKRRKGVPQGSPISPLLSNIMLHELDKEMERLGLNFVRYADDFSIYCKTKAEAAKANRLVIAFLRGLVKNQPAHTRRFWPVASEKQQQMDLMEIIEDRHARKATIIASQLPVANWYEIIGEETIADAILDRLVHTSHRVELKGESLRKK